MDGIKLRVQDDTSYVADLRISLYVQATSVSAKKINPKYTGKTLALLT